MGINIAGSRFFKNIKISDSNGKGLEKHFNAPVLSDDGKTLTISTDKNNLFDFSSENTKDIFVTITSHIGYNYTLQNGKSVKVTADKNDSSFSYSISSKTTEKAKITFSNKNDDGEITGTLNYNGTQEFNIGQSFVLEFVVSDDFDFIAWDVSNSDNLICKKNGTELEVTVTGTVNAVTIKPICQKKPTVSFTVTTNIGNVFPVGTVTARVGDVVTLTYTGNNDYYFPGWVVINSAIDEVLTREQINEFFECENWTKETIDIRIKSESNCFEIAANSYLRPHVYSHEPVNSEDGVTQDTNVKIYFDSDIDEMSLYYTDDEEYNITKQDPKAKFKMDKKGKYAYTSADGQLYYKNITIKNLVTGENLSKYFNRPYLSDKRTMILPVNKVLNESTKKPDVTLLPPGGIQVYIQLGTAFGFYENDNLIPLVRDTNLTWFYSTKHGVDEKVPSFGTVSVKGTNNSKVFDAYSSCNSEPKTQDDLKKCYLKDNKLVIDATLLDESKNLSEVYLNYVRCQDEYYYSDLTEETKKVPLSFTKNNVNFKVENTEIDLKQLSGVDGTYKLYLSAFDDSGNYCESKEFYVRLDKTAPELPDLSKFKIFKSYKKIKFANWIVPDCNDINHPENKDFEKIEFYIDGVLKDTKTISGSGLEATSCEAPAEQNGKYKFIVYDIFGNTVETKEFDYDINIAYGSILYSDQWILDWWNYKNYNHIGNGIFAVGYVGHNYTVNSKNIYIFNISTDDTKAVYSEASGTKASVENTRIDNLNSTFRTKHEINFKLPDSTNYTAIFGDDSLIKKNYDFMTEKLNFVPYKDYKDKSYYWLSNFVGNDIDNGRSYKVVYFTTKYIFKDDYSWASNKELYRFISNYTFN